MAHLILDGEVARGVATHNSDLRAPSSVPSRTAAMQGGEYGVNSLPHTPWAQRGPGEGDYTGMEQRHRCRSREEGRGPGKGQYTISSYSVPTQTGFPHCCLMGNTGMQKVTYTLHTNASLSLCKWRRPSSTPATGFQSAAWYLEARPLWCSSWCRGNNWNVLSCNTGILDFRDVCPLPALVASLFSCVAFTHKRKKSTDDFHSEPLS